MDEERDLHGCQRLFRMAQAGTDMKPLAARLLDRARRNENAANSLMDLSWVFSFTGEEASALSTQALALQLQQLYHLPPSTGPAKLRLLALMASGEYLANTPLECLLEGSDVALDLLFLGPELPFPKALPDHDLLFTAVRESEENLPLLMRIDELVAKSLRPVINAPSRIPRLARDQASARLHSAPGVAMPGTARVPRARLIEHLERETSFPVLVRAVGAHRGQNLKKIDKPSAGSDCLAELSAPEFYVAPFVDYRSPDGQFRKYRIVLIDGRPFAAHLAISDHWMVNFVNSHMELSAEKREEEAAFMAHFEEGFARRHAEALRAIHERLELDYVVIDCAEMADGQLLIFEVDSAAIVHANDPVDLFAYKQQSMRKLFGAFRDMLVRSAH